MKSIKFMALGGAQSVGSSCYFLQLGKSNILLDCGITKKRDIVVGPNLQLLLRSQLIDSFSQIDHVYVSHAHSDHVGYLPDLLQLAPNSSIYMTPLTKVLSSYRLNENSKKIGNYSSFKKLGNDKAFENCIPVSYMQKLKQGDYRVTFFPAGHIPGAMMTMFEYNRKRILYTGDYSAESEFGLGGYWLPDNLNIDIMIICALHAKHPLNRRSSNTIVDRAVHLLMQGRAVYCCTNEPSRILELLLMLNNGFQRKGIAYPIYLEDSAMEIVRMIERINPAILQENNYIVGSQMPVGPHVLIGSRPKEDYDKNYHNLNIVYTLHEDYGEMKSFIKKINPRLAIMVHCAEGMGYPVIEQELLRDADSKTQMIFPREGEIYSL